MTTRDSEIGLDLDSLGAIHYAALALAVVTGVIHLVLGVRFLPSGGFVGLPGAFILAGLGFFGAAVLFLFNVRRRWLYVVGIPFTGVQILLYFALNWPDVNAFGIGDKVIQLVLVVLLVVLYRRESAA